MSSTITQTIFATKEQLIQERDEARPSAIDNVFINRAPFDFKLHKEEDRLRTFETVECMTDEYKSQLALTGFYYKYTNTMQCYFCTLTIKLPNRSLKEDLINYHLRNSLFCPLLKGQTTNNIPIDSERLMEILQSSINAVIGEDECGHGQPIRRSIPPINYPHYESTEERLLSFDDWPRGLTQTKEDLANAGFFYSGSSDKVICFSCGLRLKEWEPQDVPLFEHAKWLKGCEFMSLTFGDSYIQSIKCSVSSNCNTATINNNKNPSTSSMVNGNLMINEENSTDVKATSTCKICLVNPANILFQPCNHCATCVDCSLKLHDQKCPVCRSPIQTKTRIYFS